jgi:hypothetical protein
MKKLQPHETELTGAWIKNASGIQGDETCLRIRWLISEVLKIVGIEKDSGGWETLYRDPADGRYWLQWYPQGEYQGGGPPALKNILLTDADLQNRFVSPEKWKIQTEEFRRERNIQIISSEGPSETK